MAEQHPIIPPPELVEQWDREAVAAEMPEQVYIATQTARWGADQELKACCKWVDTPINYEDCRPGEESEQLRAARRPKPPSLKEQALDSWDRLRNKAWCEEIDFDLDFIRRALEQLND